jgi:hypothetical protein
MVTPPSRWLLLLACLAPAARPPICRPSRDDDARRFNMLATQEACGLRASAARSPVCRCSRNDGSPRNSSRCSRWLRGLLATPWLLSVAPMPPTVPAAPCLSGVSAVPPARPEVAHAQDDERCSKAHSPLAKRIIREMADVACASHHQRGRRGHGVCAAAVERQCWQCWPTSLQNLSCTPRRTVL